MITQRRHGQSYRDQQIAQMPMGATHEPILPSWAWALAALVVVTFGGPFLWS